MQNSHKMIERPSTREKLLIPALAHIALVCQPEGQRSSKVRHFPHYTLYQHFASLIMGTLRNFSYKYSLGGIESAVGVLASHFENAMRAAKAYSFAANCMSDRK